MLVLAPAQSLLVLALTVGLSLTVLTNHVQQLGLVSASQLLTIHVVPDEPLEQYLDFAIPD